MTHRSYYYNRAGEPITVQEYMRLHELALDSSEAWEEQRRVARDVLDDGTVVSTVWAGMVTSYDENGAPLIFETMVFGGPADQLRRRYPAEAAALSGHEEIVHQLRNGQAPTRDTNQGEMS